MYSNSGVTRWSRTPQGTLASFSGSSQLMTCLTTALTWKWPGCLDVLSPPLTTEVDTLDNWLEVLLEVWAGFTGIILLDMVVKHGCEIAYTDFCRASILWTWYSVRSSCAKRKVRLNAWTKVLAELLKFRLKSELRLDLTWPLFGLRPK